MNQIFSTRAGRAFRREGTDFIDADLAKGFLSLEFEDELLHLRWRCRDGSTSSREDTDLVVFPSDASLEKISNDPAVRMYVLKFQSSNQLHFFWFQDPSSDKDANDIAKINELLSETNPQPPGTGESLTENATMTGNTVVNPPQAAPAGPLNQTQLSSFVQELVRGLQRGNTRAGVAPDLALSDILTPSVLASVLQDSKAVESLAPFLPQGLLSSTPPAALLPRQDMLRQIVASAPFRASVRSLDQALSTGLLGGLVTSLGMPAEAGLGIHPFLEAVQVQAAKTKEMDREMDQDEKNE
ncbi:hypothetical protein FRC08_009991 [Ceratobasidium sp. 394]|nr:hypothetical protein FRC08_009991 [Ceratobasidium sp. 394]KAG9101031.1 hypothetical protein FS749_010889 [Ceratobasidium sp. UAMH 11750]